MSPCGFATRFGPRPLFPALPLVQAVTGKAISARSLCSPWMFFSLLHPCRARPPRELPGSAAPAPAPSPSHHHCAFNNRSKLSACPCSRLTRWSMGKRDFVPRVETHAANVPTANRVHTHDRASAVSKAQGTTAQPLAPPKRVAIHGMHAPHAVWSPRLLRGCVLGGLIPQWTTAPAPDALSRVPLQY